MQSLSLEFFRPYVPPAGAAGGLGELAIDVYLTVLEAELSRTAREKSSRPGINGAVAQNFVTLFLREDREEQWREAVAREKARRRGKSEGCITLIEDLLAPNASALTGALRAARIAVQQRAGKGAPDTLAPLLTALERQLARPARRYLVLRTLEKVTHERKS